jgi:hypothetical protein
LQGGSGGNIFFVPNNGGHSPDSGESYALNPSGGNFFALTDQNGPGSYSLTQSFTVAPGTIDVTVSFDLFANNYATGTFNNGRDFNTVPNQNAEVDILLGGANPFIPVDDRRRHAAFHGHHRRGGGCRTEWANLPANQRQPCRIR